MNWDRLLSVLGILLSLPGFFLLFLAPEQTVGVLVLLLGFTLLTAAFVTRYLIDRPPYTFESADVTLTVKDDKGKEATIDKNYRIKPNFNNLKVLSHRHISADGSVSDIKWNNKIVPNKDIQLCLKEYKVDILFQKALTRGEIFKGTLSYKVQDSLTENHEGILYVTDFPTKMAKITVRLPEERPCTRAYGYKQVGDGKRKLTNPLKISGSKREITMTLKNPPIGAEYWLWWDW